MARWEPEASERLQKAALELYLERGFEAVTAGEIAERAGLGRRTFFRYFADKREVLFAGSERLAETLTEEVADADPDLAPLDAVLAAGKSIGERLAEVSTEVARRRQVIESSPELRERERTKAALLGAAAIAGLERRGVEPERAHLVAELGTVVFRNAFAHWIDAGAGADFAECFQAAAAELRAAVA